jgi:hypothetical protein
MRLTLVPRVAAVLVAVQWSLRHRGFARTLAHVERTTQSSASSRTHSVAADIENLARVVATVAAFLPGRQRCLEQSLALHYLLRSNGIVSVFRLGVQPHGFVSHAWVEWRGVPINEQGELIRKLVIFPSIRV